MSLNTKRMAVSEYRTSCRWVISTRTPGSGQLASESGIMEVLPGVSRLPRAFCRSNMREPFQQYDSRLVAIRDENMDAVPAKIVSGGYGFEANVHVDNWSFSAHSSTFRNKQGSPKLIPIRVANPHFSQTMETPNGGEEYFSCPLLMWRAFRKHTGLTSHLL